MINTQAAKMYSFSFGFVVWNYQAKYRTKPILDFGFQLMEFLELLSMKDCVCVDKSDGYLTLLDKRTQ